MVQFNLKQKELLINYLIVPGIKQLQCPLQRILSPLKVTQAVLLSIMRIKCLLQQSLNCKRMSSLFRQKDAPEDYGFSNNAKALFGMPSFEKAKFKIDSKNKIIKIIL